MSNGIPFLTGNDKIVPPGTITFAQYTVSWVLHFNCY